MYIALVYKSWALAKTDINLLSDIIVKVTEFGVAVIDSVRFLGS